MLDTIILSPQRVIFKGILESIILPGEVGVFEVLPYHKNIISRLIKGEIVLNQKEILPIKRGIVKVERNKVVVIVEE